MRRKFKWKFENIIKLHSSSPPASKQINQSKWYTDEDEYYFSQISTRTFSQTFGSVIKGEIYMHNLTYSLQQDLTQKNKT